jgi:hypothetical protein
VADDGSRGPEIVAGYDYGPRCCATGRGGGSSVIDADGNATLIFGFSDRTGGNYTGGEYEAAVLPRGAAAPIAHERLEPSGPDGTGLDVAATPGGARIGAWVVAQSRKPNRLVQVLDAPPGRRFGPPRTIANEPVASEVTVVAERRRAAWVIWTTEEQSGARSTTAVRVARRNAGGRRWRVRTIARRIRVAGDGLRIDGTLEAAPGRDGELLVGWDECEGDRRFGTARCHFRTRWRRAGAWEATQTVAAGALATYGWDLAVDRRSRAVVAFGACQRGDGSANDECTVQISRGQDGRFQPASELGPGNFGLLAANRRGHLILMYTTGEFGPGGGDWARHARPGTITGGFEPPEQVDLGYMTSCCSFEADDRGNFAFTAGGYDGGTFLLRYRR